VSDDVEGWIAGALVAGLMALGIAGGYAHWRAEQEANREPPQPYQPPRFTETEQTYLGDLAGCAATILLKERSLPEDERGFDAEGMEALSDASQWAWENSMDLVPVEPRK
jgi:hypothetical protein